MQMTTPVRTERPGRREVTLATKVRTLTGDNIRFIALTSGIFFIFRRTRRPWSSWT